MKNLDYIPFSSEDEMYEKFKNLGFSISTIKNKKRVLKQFLYKGIRTNGKEIICKPLGYKVTNTYETLVLDVAGECVEINFDYFKEMQSSGFKINKSKE